MAKPKASAGIASATAAFALSRGWSMERINDVCGVSGLDLVNPQDRLPEDVLPRLWAALAEESPHEALGLRMAKAAPFSCLGGLAEGMQFAENLRQAVQLLTRNRLILADRAELDFIETEGTAKMRGRHPLGELDRGISDTVALALTVRLVREFLGVEGAVESVSFVSKIWGSTE
ncbi:MAG: AraC family transcriptional regulator ligand-binding domain-containing protein, partial [Acidobacteriota bacterium]